MCLLLEFRTSVIRDCIFTAVGTLVLLQVGIRVNPFRLSPYANGSFLKGYIRKNEKAIASRFADLLLFRPFFRLHQTHFASQQTSLPSKPEILYGLTTRTYPSANHSFYHSIWHHAASASASIMSPTNLQHHRILKTVPCLPFGLRG